MAPFAAGEAASAYCRAMTARPQHLVADIGATHARFALAEVTNVGAPVVLATADYSSAGQLIEAARQALGQPELAAACFAVAGPVLDGQVEVTNGGLRFEAAALSQQFGVPVTLVNDFYALAAAIPYLKHMEAIGGDPERRQRRAVCAVLGPGSGLGMSLLIPEGAGGWRVLASEGGHADLAPGNPLEQELLTTLQMKLGAVCWETVLSGPGLVHLYEAVATLWGMPPDALSPQEISARGVDAEDPVCHQTLEMFFALLGAAAGNLALTVCAEGGVYVGGGIVPQLAEFAKGSPLRRRFDERAELAHLVADVPLFLVLDENPGLIGAAACLAQSAP
ncbi:MAG: glucokinase [Pseudomonadota bacterium]